MPALGMVGLGRMGWGMTQRIREHGLDVVGYDRAPEHRDVDSLAALVEALPAPRVVWVMLPAGAPTQSTLDELLSLLAEGDVVVEGGNSNFRDSIARGRVFAERGIGYVDAGVSGGVWGLTEGFCLMVGGTDEAVAAARPFFDALAPEGGFVHAGEPGAGHFTKMVHNGIEYGLMQAYAEGYELMEAADLRIDVPATVAAWRYGSVVRSWLLDLMVRALETDPGLTKVRGYAEDSGEGRWTVDEAVRAAVPLHVISAALFARFASRQDESIAMKVIATLRNQFGGHAVLPETGETKRDVAE
ncbi:MAG TPA: decarboxylating 6-phosphogluconate dehydrogenase [Mycobacteriales bacterium]|jgi:6-phosphogluconate dehydrogenase|nr:decarboxylating 6-phosphogluconate dehydrogenase [Mycobacteriales bacterium]